MLWYNEDEGDPPIHHTFYTLSTTLALQYASSKEYM